MHKRDCKIKGENIEFSLRIFFVFADFCPTQCYVMRKRLSNYAAAGMPLLVLILDVAQKTLRISEVLLLFKDEVFVNIKDYNLIRSYCVMK